ncbi:DUF2599 domain-containing protein [Nocardia brasiliensis]|uniref:DUF2599 domain-containing protein n=1 Tax=Nocardia brasiliensis TaxID=37326 RepID=UPI003D8D32C0
MECPDRSVRVHRHTGPARRARGLAPLCVALLPVLAGCGSDAPAAISPTTTTTPPAGTPSPPRTVAATPTVDPYAGLPLIDHVTWTDTLDGARLLVVPTPAGRKTTAADAEARAWHEVLTRSPEAGTPGMDDQFRCHWIWARLIQPDKPSWNLEPWRPAVGYQATVDAQCNPGGPER